jgi:hypothetical protein
MWLGYFHTHTHIYKGYHIKENIYKKKKLTIQLFPILSNGLVALSKNRPKKLKQTKCFKGTMNECFTCATNLLINFVVENYLNY